MGSLHRIGGHRAVTDENERVAITASEAQPTSVCPPTCAAERQELGRLLPDVVGWTRPRVCGNSISTA